MMITDRSQFQQYTPGMRLSRAFSGNKIPLLQMEHLRSLDFPISCGISYELTVDQFLQQLMINDSMRGLRVHENMVVLLNTEGALIETDGRWRLLFTPGKSEKRTLPETADLYEVYAGLLKKELMKEVVSVPIPERSLKTLVAGTAPFCILDEYCKKYPGGYLAVAQNIVRHGIGELSANVPVCRYGALATADLSEIQNYHSIRRLLDAYLFSMKKRGRENAPKPLSIAVFGPPGAGKSFGVKQIAKSRGGYEITSLNLSQYESPVELFLALKEALENAVDKIPLIFFDEFDSELNGVRRGWLKYFLSPMQDGEYTLNGTLYKIKGAVFVFAGATASSFDAFLPDTEEKTKEFQAIKGPDFVSRLKGILNIKGPNPVSVTDRRHIIRRAMLMRDQLTMNFPDIFEENGTCSISPGLLSALLRVSEYRHGSRSLEFILDMSNLDGEKRYTPSCLPLRAQMNIHLDVADFMRKLEFEQLMGNAVELYAATAHEKYREQHLKEELLSGRAEEEIRLEEEMADWDQLDEFYKEGHRSQIRYLGERLVSYDMEIGVRPILPESKDSITELYGPALEKFAVLEHERWMRDKLADGWHYGKVKNMDLKIHPDIVPFEELDEASKDFIRVAVRSLPEYLKEIGYELYRKSY